MKKRITLILSLVMMLSLCSGMITTVGAVSQLNGNINIVNEIPLHYVSSSEVHTVDGFVVPNILNGYGGSATVETTTIFSDGIGGKALDDEYFVMKSTSSTVAGDANAQFIFGGGAGSTPGYYVTTANEKLVLTGDYLTTAYTPNVTKGINISMANDRSSSTARVFYNLLTFDGTGNITFINSSETVPYIPNVWYNIWVEIDTLTDTYDVWIDGNKVFNTATRLYSGGYNPKGIHILRNGCIAPTEAGAIGDLFIDNMAMFTKGTRYSDELRLTFKDAAALNFSDFKGSNTNKTEIMSNLALLSTYTGMDAGTSITWSSDKPASISNAGVVTIGINPEQVKLTATITNDGKTTTKDFFVTVPNMAVRPDTADDYDALTEAVILGSNPSVNSVTTALNLTTTGVSGNTTVSWASSNENIIATTGVVTRDANDQEVTLTATISKTGEETLVKTFNLTVLTDYAKVSKVALSALYIASGGLLDLEEDFTEGSFSVYENAYYEADDALMPTSQFPQAVIDEITQNLENAIAGLVYEAGLSISSAGTLTKDTYVDGRSGQTSNSFGSSGDLAVKRSMNTTGSDPRRSFFEFDISDIDPDSDKVILELYVTLMGSNGTHPEVMDVYGTTAGWSENGLTWNTKPTYYTAQPLDSYGPANISEGGDIGYKEFDVTDYVMSEIEKGASAVSFAVSATESSSSYVLIDSKEKAGGSPALLIAEKYPSIKNIIIDDLEAITIPELVTEATTIQLPVSGSYNSVISWSSSNPAVISNGGVVTLPNGEEDVTLIATATAYGISYNKTFNIKVKQTTAEELEYDALTFDVIKGANSYETGVIYALDLIEEGINGTPITWESSDESIISSATGAVVRNALSTPEDVLLTATIGNLEKEFNIQVVGDYYVHDECVDESKAYYVSGNLDIITEGTWRVKGFAHDANGRKGQNIIYKAGEGASFKVSTTVHTGIGANKLTFKTSTNGIDFYDFTAVAQTADTNRPVGHPGGYRLREYTSTEGLPEGTRFLQVIIPDTGSLWHNFVEEILIFDNNDEIKFDDIKGENELADAVMLDLDLSVLFGEISAAWTSSAPSVISAAGVLNAIPASDTPVSLTAVTTSNGIPTTKVYNVVAKAYEAELTVMDRPLSWYMNGSNFLALRDSSTFTVSDELYASVTAKNLTNADKDVYIAIAVYEESGRLMDIAFKKVTFEGSVVKPQTKQINLTLDNQEVDAYKKTTIKAFLWDENGITPMSDISSVTRKD